MPKQMKTSNELDDILKIIQAKTGLTLEQISQRVGYAKQYLSSARKMPSESVEKIKGRLSATFKNELNEDPGVRLAEDDHALIVVLLSRVSELLAEKRGTSSVVEIELMKSDAQSLKKLHS